MAHNTLGHLLQLTTFGESHGPAIGGVLDGMPAGILLDIDHVRRQLRRRATASGAHASTRREDDEPEIISGVFEGQTTGTPLAFMIRNRNTRPEDYDHLRELFRPSHADLTYTRKYGIRDHRGGGRSSARETATWVMAGAMIEPWLNAMGIRIEAFVSAIGMISVPDDFSFPSREEVESSPLACPHSESHVRMDNLIRELREAGDSVGGVISARICGLPAGLGEPVFGKFNAMLGHAMLSIPAVKGFELGEGFHAAELTGSQHNDPISSFLPNGNALTVTNHAGGVLGGITNGEDVTFRVAFKPIASISRPQTTLNRQGEKVSLEIKGRHDVCPVPRAVPIVEGLAALVTADFILRQYAHEKAVQQKGSVEGLFST